MENQTNTQGFNYTYSAKEQDEVRRIREKYVAGEESKMDKLRRMDKQVTKKGTLCAVIVGVVGTLIMGVGMTFVLKLQSSFFVPGIIIGIVGMGFMAVALPVYNLVTQKEREKIAPEILRLTEELMK